MVVLFKASDTFIIQGRGLVLSGYAIQGTIQVGMLLTIESFPRQLTIDGVEMINTLHHASGLIGLVFHSTDRQEIALWKSLDVKNKVLEVFAQGTF